MDTRDNLVELGLRRPSSSEAAVLMPPAAADGPLGNFVDRLLGLLVEITPDAESQDTDKFREKVQGYRVAAADMSRRMELPRIIEACLLTCETYFKTSRKYHRSREAEFTEIIAILREAAKVAVGDGTEFHAQMVASTDRFNRLGQLDDVRELKHRLAAEVHVLRKTVDEKQQRDQRAYIQLNQRVESLQARLSEVEEEAALDPLTRVANRRGFQRTLARMFSQAKGQQMPMSLAMIDVDNFKVINDTHGHPIGDRVLLCTAQWLTKGLRQTDFVARYGGEEFAVLLGAATAAQVEDRMREVVAGIASSSYEYELLGKKERVRFTVSCGLTDLQDGDTEETLIQRADEALYDAKRKGKNRVIVKKRSALKSLLSWG
jgi:diguanylate cyclase (GGDEF)-like protein